VALVEPLATGVPTVGLFAWYTATVAAGIAEPVVSLLTVTVSLPWVVAVLLLAEAAGAPHYHYCKSEHDAEHAHDLACVVDDCLHFLVPLGLSLC
jgi:hypothetical protein